MEHGLREQSQSGKQSPLSAMTLHTIQYYQLLSIEECTIKRLEMQNVYDDGMLKILMYANKQL